MDSRKPQRRECASKWPEKDSYYYGQTAVMQFTGTEKERQRVRKYYGMHHTIPAEV